MSGSTQGETNDRNPAAKAASSVTFWSMGAQSRCVSGITPGIDEGSGRPANLTGGKSWNMTSHFHRSDGFDACSQCFAVTGRANARSVSPAYAGFEDIAAATSARTCALLV